MPRGIRTSNQLKPDLVEKLCKKIGLNITDDIFNPKNGTITKELLQEVSKYLKLSCDNIDFNTEDGTGSAGFIEKILLNLS